jgi:benzoyl-CoA reductase/2-hydroxyglutaryl-CoA dehydratase subunit BcrC/BadD/HgdB
MEKINSDRFERIKKTGNIHYSMEIKKNLAEITDDFPDNLDSMGYFYKRFEHFTQGNGNLHEGEKVVASMCVHVPLELIYATGAVPVRICAGAYATDQVGAEFLPAKTCPMVKSTLGALYLDILPGNIKPKLIVNPTTCDQKKKVGEIAEEIGKPFFTLEVPPTKDSEEARQYWIRVVKKFIRKLESTTGTKLTRRRLKKAIKMVSKAQEAYRQFNTLRRTAPVIYGKDAILVTNTYFFDDIMSWTENLLILNKELEQRIVEKKMVAKPNSPRILLTGSPSIFPNMKLPLLVEKLGGIVVNEEFCSTSRIIWDTVAVDEWFLYDMIPAVADRYLKPSTCPNFTPNTDRERKLLKGIDDYAVDGVIYQTFTGCQLYDMESRKIGQVIEEKGIQTLYIESDYNPDDFGQLTTRLEAFLDSLKNKKQ